MNGANFGAISDSAIVRFSSACELQGRWKWSGVFSDAEVEVHLDKLLQHQSQADALAHARDAKHCRFK